MPLLKILADGHWHSGQVVADALGISRAGVWKQVARSKAAGLRIESAIGRGYRLSRPIEFLNHASISRSVAASGDGTAARIEIFDDIDSTNSYLFARVKPETGQLGVCLAEYQSGGRGRRGRTWIAPFGGGLCLSLGWMFAAQPADIGALGLAAGVVTRRVLAEATGLAIEIKWPNDLILKDKKLGGILVELSAEANGPCLAVIGIGINVSVDAAALESIRPMHLPAVDLSAALGGRGASRNQLASALITALGQLLESYPTGGFAPYHAELRSVDYLQGRDVRVQGDTQAVTGIAMGIGSDGALLVETEGGLCKLLSGEVSVGLLA